MRLPAIALGALLLAARGETVRTGLDVLVRDGCRPLLGKRIGLVTNHSAVDARGRSIIDVLASAPGFRLAALFSPEHGIRGTADEAVASGKDEKTGLPVHSLYGKTRKPTGPMLENVDLIVFDIQDVGARYYTYITTLALVMEAAREHDKPVLVLDRPNPIGGEEVEGPVLEEGLRGSFIGYFALPTRHGMTLGELARMYNEEFKIGCRLEVVRMDGWKRSMYFDDTGLPWVNPSPNMRTLAAALCYPGLGALEGTNLSVGRGTEKPFSWYGAPWIDGIRVTAELTSRNLPGVRWKPVSFTPARQPGLPEYPHTGTSCGGFEVEIIDRAAFRPVGASIQVLEVLFRLYPAQLQFGRSCAMIGLRSIEQELRDGKAPEAVIAAWQSGLAEFRRARAKYLLY